MLPIEIQQEIRELIKNALLQYLLKKYIKDLMVCHGGLPSIEQTQDEDEPRTIVRVIKIKGINDGS